MNFLGLRVMSGGGSTQACASTRTAVAFWGRHGSHPFAAAAAFLKAGIFRALILFSLLALSREALAFSLNDPEGPRFASRQKAAQLASGSSLLNNILSAYNSGAASYTVASGDYRFGQETYGRDGRIYSVQFKNLQRSPTNPFTIDATGATFWFDLGDDEMPTAHFALGFIDCSNVVFNGATLDRDTRGVIEGTITQVDTAHNRFEILPSPGVAIPTKFNSYWDQRILPFKADGKFCAPLYALQSGGVHLKYTGITPSTNRRYWVTMADSALMDTLNDPNWIRAYGNLGNLSVGDGICCLYTTTLALTLHNCDHMTVSNVGIYMAKGGSCESYGGANTWKNCYFGPRPGTCQWKGADGFMIDAAARGPTIDNVTISNAADDLVNIHGYWSHVMTVTGSSVTLDKVAASAVIGDTVNFYDPNLGTLLGKATITAIAGGTEVTLSQPSAGFANAAVEWVDHECANWTIRNCNWHDSYQRILIQSGPGTIANCTFTRLGSGVSLENGGFGRSEGGMPSNIIITGNSFTDVSPMPDGRPIANWIRPVTASASNLAITSNTFNNSSKQAIYLGNINGLTVAHDTFINSFLYTAGYRPGTVGQPIWLYRCSNAVITDNSVAAAGKAIVSGTLSGSQIVDWDAKSSNIELIDSGAEFSAKK